MTARLSETLREVADASPPIVVPAGLFDRARRAQGRRRALAAAAVVVLVALVVWTGLPALGVGPRIEPAGGDNGLPTQLYDPPPFTAGIERAPLGRALAVYNGPAAFLGDSEPLTLVGPGNQYRTYNRPEWTYASDWSPTFLLSPDGRYLLMAYWPPTYVAGSRLLDTADGSVRILTAGAPLAWSVDGQQAILVSFDGNPTGEAVTAVIRVVDVSTGVVSFQVTLPPPAHPNLHLTAALSPDGRYLAVQRGTALTVFGTGGVHWTNTVDGGRLAGAAAWTPDGNRLAIIGTTGELRLLDALTGLAVPAIAFSPLPGTQSEQDTARVVAWHGPIPVLDIGNRLVLWTDPAQTLLTAPAHAHELSVATDQLARPMIDPGFLSGGPVADRPGVIVVGVAGLALAAIAAAMLWRRSRRR